MAFFKNWINMWIGKLERKIIGIEFIIEEYLPYLHLGNDELQFQMALINISNPLRSISNDLNLPFA